MDNLDIITSIAALQDKFNCQVNPDWKTATNQKWYRASWIECGEATGFIDWKWWKHGEVDIKQLFIELVDIFHFVISDCMIRKYDFVDIVIEYERSPKYIAQLRESRAPGDFEIVDVIELLTSSLLLENLQGAVITNAGDIINYDELNPAFSSIAAFFILLRYIGFDLEDLYKGYIGKNVLNKFRQDNGYKTGQYIKNWAVEPKKEFEDNMYLEQVMERITELDEDTMTYIYTELNMRYQRVLMFNKP